jgi:hypothetical protein
MPASVELEIRDLQERKRHIMHLLKPLSRAKSGPACDQQLVGNTAIVLCAHEGGMLQSKFADWRFSTCKQNYWANYYELWTLIDSKNEKYRLDKAYLTIYRRNKERYTGEEKELLCLHCDPYELDQVTNPSAVYKRSPHLHVEAADHPIPKAHFSLTIGNSPAVLASTQTLTQTLSLCIKMIRCEVLDKMDAS